jgi:SWI/SNF-related matrix-associated actin-dependent regulator 1 of chromatin subfamily A
MPILLQHDPAKPAFFVKFPAPCPERDVVKSCGFRFDGATASWVGRAADAVRLIARGGVEVAESAADVLRAAQRQAAESERAKAANIAASFAATSVDAIPLGAGAVAAGHDFLPYQKAGIAYAAGKKAVLIADEMGLGKTPQSVGIANLDLSCRKILIVCPASLKGNWRREWLKWDAKGLSVAIAEGQKPWPCLADVVVVNYDIVERFRAEIDATHWHMLVMDECHMVKNAKAQRTRAVFRRPEKREKGKPMVPGRAAIQADRVVLLTGTPILNRPIEMFPMLERIDPEGLGANFMAFAKRYCDAEMGRFGWDFSGASNLEELQERLRGSVMVRRLKADVLTELPPKRRQLMPLDRAESKNLKAAIAALESEDEAHATAIAEAMAKAELAKASGEDAYRAAAATLADTRKVAFEDMARARYVLAVAKAPVVAERIADLLAEDPAMKIVVMAHHGDVVRVLREKLQKFGCAEVTGKTPVPNRQGECDRFQTDKSCRVFLGTIRAAGVGLTLTAAHVVAFVELDWVPGNVSQAEDRCHRIGQRDSVLVWHFVVDDSLDSRMVATLVEKQSVADAALNNLDPSSVAVAGEAPLDSFDVVSDVAVAAEEARLAAAADHREGLAADGRARIVAERARNAERARAETAHRRVSPRAATMGLSGEQLDREGEAMSPAQRETAMDAVRALAASDKDFANLLNDTGFSKADVFLGHSIARLHPSELNAAHHAIARRLVVKYRRQLPAHVVDLVAAEAA